MTGGTDARIQLNTGGSGTGTGNDTVHIRGDGDSMKLMVAADGNYILENNGTEHMRINSSGNVGIGTSSPGQTLSVTSASGTVAEFLGESGPHGLRIYGNDAGFGAIGHVSSGSYDLRIESDGGVGIGGPTTINYALEVEGAQIGRGSVYFHTTMPLTDNTYDLGHGSYRWDDIFATNNVINTSDRNLKNTITNSDLGLDFINRLSPKSYKFNGGTRTHYGLIAQDVETVLSDISKPTADFAGFIKMIPEEEAPKHEENPNTETTYGLRYGEFIAPLIKALQEADDKIEALTARIEALES